MALLYGFDVLINNLIDVPPIPETIYPPTFPGNFSNEFYSYFLANAFFCIPSSEEVDYGIRDQSFLAKMNNTGLFFEVSVDKRRNFNLCNERGGNSSWKL